MTLPPLSLYVHLPWCVRKCPYCDFNSHTASDGTPFREYVDAITVDIKEEASKANARPIQSIFIGGGTPSLFSPDDIDRILRACRTSLHLADDCEITMEANPGTVECGNLKGYRDAGVNRLSIGAQRFNADMLQVLGRIHGPDEITSTVENAGRAGFENINIDVMFGLPGQGVSAALEDVDAVIALSPPHVSYYQLTLEPNTVFFARPPDGLPDNDLAWTIQQEGQAALVAAGYEQYEVSAFAKPSRQCRHNLNYWQFGDYLAAGAGAHGKLTEADLKVRRYRKPANPAAYIESIADKAVAEGDAVAADDLTFEFMLNALRLRGGFTTGLFESRTGQDLSSTPEFDAAIEDGLIEASDDGHWRPTADGFRMLNDLQARFLP